MGEKTGANEREEAEAVTTIIPEEFACPECGKKVVAFILLSHNSFGGKEPFFIARDYVRCQWCGHHIEKEGAIEFLSDDPDERSLQLDPLFEPEPEKNLAEADRDRVLDEAEIYEEEGDPGEGETEVIFGTWIPGSRRPKESGD